MIPVSQAAEPSSFNSNVRAPGRAFLSRVPSPNSKQFRGKSFWKYSSADLNAAYRRVCAYTGFYLVVPGSVDHFMPKTSYPNLAYEWSNYRLAMARVNQHKGDSTDVIDPFIVQTGWFVLDFPSCLVKPGTNLSPVLQSQVSRTISVLRLNDDDILVQERCDILLAYSNNEIDLNFLSRRYPFLAHEISRQGLEENTAQLFKRRTSTNR